MYILHASDLISELSDKIVEHLLLSLPKLEKDYCKWLRVCISKEMKLEFRAKQKNW